MTLLETLQREGFLSRDERPSATSKARTWLGFVVSVDVEASLLPVIATEELVPAIYSYAEEM